MFSELFSAQKHGGSVRPNCFLFSHMRGGNPNSKTKPEQRETWKRTVVMGWQLRFDRRFAGPGPFEGAIILAVHSINFMK
ncbi:predicted protein [Histoplasma mississippiense (nom. inval.)]|uniref:predicted protein n=1 Tax=Ajellomyces capsulatus (strain NAm1 / WU24) TaxID=2059318 RepID=UPI000157BFD7|nr:predicted protein [Histoplasma mississippiense (nom. inval.)]EDN06834.1 predicted protein [Histoplasma mississippiense (nom. inval.)]